MLKYIQECERQRRRGRAWNENQWQASTRSYSDETDESHQKAIKPQVNDEMLNEVWQKEVILLKGSMEAVEEEMVLHQTRKSMD